ncbi:MAG TPA: bifunctional 5,10-methylenetetrahydrofolate dehydrogenase/5,10-methenyltetrahydrofolate cyclohydrolase [Candidatus Nanoarchaeia archaeon]
MVLVDGKALRDRFLQSLKLEIQEKSLQPHLAIVLVGDDEASLRYIKQKQKAAVEIGAQTTLIELPGNIDQEPLEAEISRLDKDKKVTGIIVQLPLPENLDKEKIFSSISQEKDVDGLRPDSPYTSAAPAAVMEILQEYKVSLKGKTAVVLGSSGFVGLRLVGLFKKEQAQVVEIDENTQPRIDNLVQKGDIVVSAVGKPNLVTADMIKNGATVIDVGFNTDPQTGKLVGDVDFEAVKEKASLISPVPGGVGPVTVAILMKNLVSASEEVQGPALSS